MIHLYWQDCSWGWFYKRASAHAWLHRSETSSVLHLLALLLPAGLPPQTHGGAHWCQGLPVHHVRQAFHPEKLAKCAHAHPPCRAHLPVQRVPPGLYSPYLAGAPCPAARPPRPANPRSRPGAWSRHDLTYQAQPSSYGRALRYGWRGWHGWQYGQHAEPRSFLHLERGGGGKEEGGGGVMIPFLESTICS